MPELYELAKLVVFVTGPLMFASVIIMYISVMLSIRRAPSPKEMMYLYVTRNIANRKHAGILTYLLAVSSVFFLAAVAALAYLQLTNPS